MPAGLQSGVGNGIAERRVALVIGNGNYKNAATLDNPTNDAIAIAGKLREFGFDVIEGVDLSVREMDEKIGIFADRIEKADAALFYFAGHGLQVDGENYLVPVDAELANEGQLRRQTIGLQDQLSMMSGKAAVSIVLLDCCRDNPFVRSLGRRRTRGGVSRGLAEVGIDEGSFIAFATGPGSIANDGDGQHSPFTEALLQHIASPGQSLADIMTEVTNSVSEATQEAQTPWYHSSLRKRFYFIKQQATAPAPLPDIPPATHPSSEPDKHIDQDSANTDAQSVPRSTDMTPGSSDSPTRSGKFGLFVGLTTAIILIAGLGLAYLHFYGTTIPIASQPTAAQLLRRLDAPDANLAKDIAGFLAGPAAEDQKRGFLHTIALLSQSQVVVIDAGDAVPDNCRAPTPLRAGDTTLPLVCSGFDGTGQKSLLWILAAIPAEVWSNRAFAAERDLARLAAADFDAARRQNSSRFDQQAASDLAAWRRNLGGDSRPKNPVTLQFAGQFLRGNAQAIMDRLVSFGWNIAGVQRVAAAANLNEIRYGDKAKTLEIASVLFDDLKIQGLEAAPVPNTVIGNDPDIDIYISTPLPSWDSRSPGYGWCYQEFDSSKPAGRQYLIACHPSKPACLDARGNAPQKEQSECLFLSNIAKSGVTLKGGGWAQSWFAESGGAFGDPFPRPHKPDAEVIGTADPANPVAIGLIQATNPVRPQQTVNVDIFVCDTTAEYAREAYILGQALKSDSERVSFNPWTATTPDKSALLGKTTIFYDKGGEQNFIENIKEQAGKLKLPQVVISERSGRKTAYTLEIIVCE